MYSLASANSSRLWQAWMLIREEKKVGMLLKVQRFNRCRWSEGALREERAQAKAGQQARADAGSGGAVGGIQFRGTFACGGCYLEAWG